MLLDAACCWHRYVFRLKAEEIERMAEEALAVTRGGTKDLQLTPAGDAAYMISTAEETEGLPPLPTPEELKAAEEADAAAAAALEVELGAVEEAVDISDPAAYSIQEAKLKTEEDNRRREAEIKKDLIRAQVRYQPSVLPRKQLPRPDFTHTYWGTSRPLAHVATA